MTETVRGTVYLTLGWGGAWRRGSRPRGPTGCDQAASCQVSLPSPEGEGLKWMKRQGHPYFPETAPSLVNTRTSADSPAIMSRDGVSSNAIRTGTRCDTLTQLPVAFWPGSTESTDERRVGKEGGSPCRSRGWPE